MKHQGVAVAIALIVLASGMVLSQERTARQIGGAVDQYTVTTYPFYGAVVVPSDTEDLPQPGIVRANDEGQVKVLCLESAVAITLTLQAGSEVECLVKRVYDTDTDDESVVFHVFY